MRRTPSLPIAILVVILCGIVGVVLFHAAADPKPHTVVLKWNPPAPQPGVTISTYNILRGTHSGGPYEKIAGVMDLTYIDRDVSSGKTYYYVVRSVDGTDRESPASQEVTATVP